MLDYSKPTPPLPMHAQKLSEQILQEWNDVYSRQAGHETNPLNQLTINEYMPGQGIAAHTDTKSCFGSLVFILNLGSGITMNLTRSRCSRKDCNNDDPKSGDDSGESQGDGRDRDVSCPRKCLYLPVRSLVRRVGTTRP